MHIIAGSGKGRRILSVPKRLGVRPISSRMRQSLFDIIRPRLPGSRFLDLFAGTGAVGLEAISRGAETAVFVDRDQRCVKVIEKNLARAGWLGRGKAFRANVLGPLGWLEYRSGIKEFDLIFMGPPYWEGPPKAQGEGGPERGGEGRAEPTRGRQAVSEARSAPAQEADRIAQKKGKPLHVTQGLLANIAAAGILAPDGWIVAQHQAKESPQAPPGLEHFRSSSYGDTVVAFFRRAGRPRSPLASQ